MSSTIHFTFALFFLFCSINKIFAEPICTLNDDYGHDMVKCRNIVRINTSAIDQQLISVAAPSTIPHVDLKGEQFRLSQSTLKPFVNMNGFLIDGRNKSVNAEDGFEKSTIDSNAFVENKKMSSIWLLGISFPTVENLRGVMQPLFGRLYVLVLGHCSFSQTNESSYDPFQVFNDFTKLGYVDIEYSGLTTIPANAFQKSANSLVTLRLEHNNITTINRDAFKSLNELSRLHLGDNQITNIESGTFDHLTSLEYLGLDRNRISQLPNILFGKSRTNLEDLYLRNNKLTSIHPTTFKGLTKLEKLSLEDNDITSIEPGTFDDLIALRTIYLTNNRISQLPRNLFEKTGLRYLYIQDNPIRNLSDRNFTRANDDNKLTVIVS